MEGKIQNQIDFFSDESKTQQYLDLYMQRFKLKIKLLQ